jgi:hypothetical protein
MQYDDKPESEAYFTKAKIRKLHPCRALTGFHTFCVLGFDARARKWTKKKIRLPVRKIFAHPIEIQNTRLD